MAGNSFRGDTALVDGKKSLSVTITKSHLIHIQVRLRGGYHIVVNQFLLYLTFFVHLLIFESI
jgi:hypothetical protein